MAGSLRRIAGLGCVIPRGNHGLGKWRAFSSSAVEEKGLQESGKSSMNLFSAVNQALHIALDTDPRSV